MEVDKFTLQHPRFANVFSLGDAAGLPTSKTGAAIRKQAPVAVENLISSMHGKPLAGRYDGYTSCPLVTGYGRLVLAEFDYEGRPQETFPIDQSKDALQHVSAQGLRLAADVLERHAARTGLKPGNGGSLISKSGKSRKIAKRKLRWPGEGCRIGSCPC